jgi:predicted ATP-grasp superfamily ATP-dependent carboligase
MRNMLPLATIGFSTRAICQACQHLGLLPVSLDAFADFDCQKAAEISYRLPNWGASAAPDSIHSIVQILLNHGNPKILLAGGAENWPDLLAQLERHFEVLGPTTSQLQVLRNPSFWRDLANLAGIGFPLTHPLNHPDASASDVPPAEKLPTSWLCKSYAGAGGLHVTRFNSLTTFEDAASPSRPAKHYLQQWIPGRVIGAHCNLSASASELLGITEALTQEDWFGPTEFVYRGAWGPRPVSEHPQLTQPLLRLAEAVRVATGLRGWVQFDLIEASDGQLWLLEINPRWAAGMELLVDTGRTNPVEAHLRAFGLPASSNHGDPRPESQVSCSAKAILYAPAPLELTDRLVSQLQRFPGIADIPADSACGQVIERGHPVLTVKAGLDAATARSLSAPERKARLLAELKLRSEQIFALSQLSGTTV